MSNSNIKQSATTMTAGFGAAVASLYAAPEVQADVVGLTYSPDTVFFTSSSTNASVGLGTVGGFGIGSIGQYNDSVGKSMLTGAGISSFALVANGQSINTASFSGTSSLAFATDSSGSAFIAFRSSDGNLGWFSVNLGGFGGDIVYGLDGGQYGTNGESLIVGTAVPAPAGLLALAMGATGLRGRRRKSAVAS